MNIEPAKSFAKAASATMLQAWTTHVAPKLPSEAQELGRHFLRQVFNQIPAVSAAVGIFAGTWVASTFTTSPWKATLARLGVMKGGTRVVSGPTYKFLSTVLPMLAVAVTAWLVQKALRRYRELQLQRDMEDVAARTGEVQAAVAERMVVLEKAASLGLLSSSEFATKKADLYARHARRLPANVHKLIISKIS